jgi:hypothetical protein
MSLFIFGTDEIRAYTRFARATEIGHSTAFSSRDSAKWYQKLASAELCGHHEETVLRSRLSVLGGQPPENRRALGKSPNAGKLFDKMRLPAASCPLRTRDRETLF